MIIDIIAKSVDAKSLMNPTPEKYLLAKAEETMEDECEGSPFLKLLTGFLPVRGIYKELSENIVNMHPYSFFVIGNFLTQAKYLYQTVILSAPLKKWL